MHVQISFSKSFPERNRKREEQLCFLLEEWVCADLVKVLPEDGQRGVWEDQKSDPGVFTCYNSLPTAVSKHIGSSVQLPGETSLSGWEMHLEKGSTSGHTQTLSRAWFCDLARTPHKAAQTARSPGVLRKSSSFPRVWWSVWAIYNSYPNSHNSKYEKGGGEWWQLQLLAVEMGTEKCAPINEHTIGSYFFFFTIIFCIENLVILELLFTS